MSNPTTPAPAPAAWLGWDWADLKHDLHLFTATQPRGTHTVLANQPAVLHAHLQRLHAQFPDQAVVLAFEANRSALLPIFSAYTPWLRIYPINPKSLARYREALHPSGTKDDRLDCRLLAELVRTHQAELRPWTPPDPLTQELALLVEHRRRMVDQRTALANQLKALLKSYFPQSLDWLHDDTTVPFAALWVRQWPSLAALQSATPGTIRRFYRRHDHHLTQRLEALIAARAQTVAVSTATAWISPHALHAQDLACQLHTLAQRLAQTEAFIAQKYAQHPAYRLVHSLPGAGPALGPRLAALLSDDPTRFADAQALATATAPAPASSTRPSWSSPSNPSATAPGPPSSTPPKRRLAGAATASSAPWPSNGAASSTPSTGADKPTTRPITKPPSACMAVPTHRPNLPPNIHNPTSFI
jgi:transposase